MNINMKLACHELKHNKQDSKATIFMATIIFVLLLSMAILIPLYFKADSRKVLDTNGHWIYYNRSVSQENYRFLKKHNDQVAAISQEGLANYGQSFLVVRVENNLSDLVNTKTIIKGKFPGPGEIAVSQEVLNKLDHSGKLGNIIKIEYLDNDGNHQIVEAKLSGIILDTGLYKSGNENQYSQNIIGTVSLGEIVLPFNDQSNDYGCFVYDDDLAKVTGTSAFYDVYAAKSNNSDSNCIYNEGYQTTAYEQFSQSIQYLTIIAAIVLIGITVIAGITLSSMSRKTHDYTLLRAVGQTKRQLYLMLLMETAIIDFIGLLFGSIITIFTSLGGYLLIKQFVFATFPFVIDLKMIIMMIIVASLIVLMGILIPGIHVCKKALIGTFDQDRFKIFSTHRHKTKYQNTFNLALKEVLQNFKLNAILVVILAFTFSSVNNLLTVHYDYHQNLDLYRQSLQNEKIEINSDISDGINLNEINKLQTYANTIKYAKTITSYNDGFKWDLSNEYLFQSSSSDEDGWMIGSTAVDYYSNDFDEKSLQEINKVMIGRMPENEHEIVVYEAASKQDLFEIGTVLTVYENYYNLDGNPEGYLYTIRDYTVVGIINQKPNALFSDDDFINLELIISDNEFARKVQDQLEDQSDDSSCYNNVYIETNDRVSLLATINQINHDNRLHTISASDQYYLINTGLQIDYQEAIIYTILLTGLAVFLFTYIVKYRTYNHQKVIGILRSIGMTKRQVYHWYINQALLLLGGGFVISMWSLLYYRYDQGMLYYFLITIIDCLIAGVIVLIYCGSLNGVLKQETIELIKFDE